MGEIVINPIHNVHKKYREMNFVNPYIFAPPVDLTTNTEIGGVASTINTPALLATKLGIDVSRITNFAIVGSDIKCKITGSYVMQTNSWVESTIITYYKDLDGLCVGADAGSIKTYGQCRLMYLPNCLYVLGTYTLAYPRSKRGYLYLPRCTQFGTTTGNNNVFFTSGLYDITNVKLYVPPSIQTANSGAVEGDVLAFSTASNNIVRYVQNYTVPSAISNLTVGTIYNTAIQINFTPPISTNTIDFYEVYLNGNYYCDINASGDYIKDLPLNTLYNITIKAVDIYFNSSIDSNSVSATTTNSAINTLSIGTVYNSAIQLNWSVPSSVYASAGLYKIYVNGVYNNTTKINGLAIGLDNSTSYSISVYALDGQSNLGSAISNIVTQTTGSTQNGSVPTTGLMAYYKLNETSGTTVLDSYGTENLVNTSVTINQNAVIKKCYKTTGFNQKLQSSSVVPITGTFSINFWIKLDSYGTSGFQGVVEQGTFFAGFGFWMNALGYLAWRINTNYNNYNSLLTLPLNEWKMVTITYSGTQIKVYIDSVLKLTVSNTTNPSTSAVRTLFFNPNNSSGILGNLDEVSFYNVALSQSDINTHYNGGAGITL